MTDTATPSRPIEIAPDLIHEHVKMIHKLAAPLAGQGIVVTTGFGEDPGQLNPQTGQHGLRLPPQVFHARVGDVRRTLAGIVRFVKLAHYNLYMPLAIYGASLPSGQKGSEKDIIACVGVVADFDDPEAAKWAERLPIPPNYVLETSAGRFQAFYFFDKPEALEAAKPVAERLKAFARCDHGTSDISHVWRVPGALNWPNAKKVAEGRSRVPQLVRVEKPWIEGSTTSLQALSAALPDVPHTPSEAAIKTGSAPDSAAAGEPTRNGRAPHAAALAGTPENQAALTCVANLPLELQDEVKRPATGDRSKALFRAIAKLIKEGLDDPTIENVIRAHPEGIGAKHADRDDLDKEIARVRAKTTTRPIVQIRGGALPLVVDEAERHLIDSDHDLFQRGSLIVRPVQEFIPISNGREVLGTRLVPLRLQPMRERLTRVADFQRLDRRQNAWYSVDCPKDVAEAYLEREGEWRLPALTRVITAPTLRPDGSLLEEPGYDAATGLYFEPNGTSFPPMPKKPDFKDIMDSAKLLMELISTFPFVDQASKAVALSAILTSLIRPSLPSAPLHAFTAPTAGSGKSLLVDLASMISTGHEAPVMSQGRTAEEFEKRLGSAFIAGDGGIAIDNCEQPLGGEFLCQVLTQQYVLIRILGQSKNVKVPTIASIYATGNNLRIIGDLTRRAIVCSLDPQVERPELRSFEVNPIELVRANRPLYVAAARRQQRDRPDFWGDRDRQGGRGARHPRPWPS